MKIETADIRWLESGLPHSTSFDDVYFSRHDAQAESRYVFLAANKLESRWASQAGKDTSFRIGELGFGSGLNFLQTWQAWELAAEKPARLHYIAFEKHPLLRADLARIYQQWPELALYCTRLLALVPEHSRGCHRLHIAEDVILDLHFGDATVQLAALQLRATPAIQAWYLDGFSPQQNPQLWQSELCELIAAASDGDTTLSSYSVAGAVRRNLQSAGFVVEKQTGFAGKRHMLFARLEKPQPQRAASAKPWFKLPLNLVTPDKTVLVIGAGLAGCSTAYALARRGWQVSLVDSADKLADGASGNAQLALRCRLFKKASPAAEFFLHSFLFAARQFSQLAAQQSEPFWHPCGVVQLSDAMNKQQALSVEAIAALYDARIIHAVSAQQASSLSGVTVNEEAMYLPNSGWVEPQLLCAAYAGDPNISSHLGCRVERLSHDGENWLAHSNNEEISERRFNTVVIANSNGALELEQSRSFPLQAVRGQTTTMTSSSSPGKLRTVLSGARSVFPSHEHQQLISASFASNISNTQIDPQDDLENLQAATGMFPGAGISELELLASRVSVRCNSSDQLPIVGPLPDVQKMRSEFAALALNAQASFPESQREFDQQLHHPNLYINVAHGSNGLASCPLNAEYLASLIAGEILPISKASADEINPARFVIRDLKKQRTT